MLKFGKVFDKNDSLPTQVIGKTKFSSPRGRVVKAANHLKHSKSLVISPRNSKLNFIDHCLTAMYLIISLLVLRAGYGIRLYRFLIIDFFFSKPNGK